MSRQALLLLKAMTYDRALGRQDRTGVVVGVLYQDGDPLSKELATEFHTSVVEIGEKLIRGMAATAIVMPVQSRAVMLATAKQLGITAFYLAPGTDAINDVRAIAAELLLTSLCGFAQCAARGIAIGVELRGDRPRLTVNRRVAKEQGCELDSSLLNVSEIVD